MFELSYNLKNIETVVKDLLPHCKDVNVILLKGDLGAGKTTLVTTFCKLLHTADNISSPTYSIINEYKTSNDRKVFHIDLYRINSLDEALDLGIDDYLDSEFYCFIEWADVIKDILPNNFLQIEIEKLTETDRKLTIFKQ